MLTIAIVLSDIRYKMMQHVTSLFVGAIRAAILFVMVEFVFDHLCCKFCVSFCGRIHLHLYLMNETIVEVFSSQTTLSLLSSFL